MKSSIQSASAAHNAVQHPQPAPTPPPVELLNQAEMARRLGITRRTLHTWVLSGAVPMIKIRGFCRFEPAKVWAALLQHEVRAAGSPSGERSSRDRHAPRRASAQRKPKPGKKKASSRPAASRSA